MRSPLAMDTVTDMARYHVATLSPTKPEILAAWVPSQPWAPDGIDEVNDIDVVGSFRFDDPDGAVGLEVHLVRAAGTLLQVPLTYRAAPFADSELISRMHHSVLGERWVYDGMHDPVMVAMLASAALTGTGQAVGVVEYEERRLVVPTPVRLAGGGWTGGPLPVDGFTIESDDASAVTMANDRIRLRVHRRPADRQAPSIGLTATWPGLDRPVVLADVQLGADTDDR